jgi:hypothetical protein
MTTWYLDEMVTVAIALRLLIDRNMYRDYIITAYNQMISRYAKQTAQDTRQSQVILKGYLFYACHCEPGVLCRVKQSFTRLETACPEVQGDRPPRSDISFLVNAVAQDMKLVYRSPEDGLV